jgi:hypothetical protein
MRRRLLDRKTIRARIDAFHIAKIAAAPKPLTLVYNGLRNGHIHAVTRQAAA